MLQIKREEMGRIHALNESNRVKIKKHCIFLSQIGVKQCNGQVEQQIVETIECLVKGDSLKTIKITLTKENLHKKLERRRRLITNHQASKNSGIGPTD